MLRVLVTSPERLVFNGQARSIILPGEKGTFEVLPLHRPLISRLVDGVVEIDGKTLRVRRGVARVAEDQVIVVVEPKGSR